MGLVGKKKKKMRERNAFERRWGEGEERGAPVKTNLKKK